MKWINRQILLGAGILALLAALAPPARGDFLPNEIVKFQQLPLGLSTSGPNAFPGHDVTSSAYPVIGANGSIVGYTGTFAADDFSDKFSTPVVHVEWYGSYVNNFTGTAGGTNQFLVAFESDVPANPLNGTVSHPGSVLSAQIVTKGALTPASGTFTETPVVTVGGETIYKYNAELNLNGQFPEQANTIYWLKIVALLNDPQVVWGWHNRDYTISDPLAAGPPLVNPGEVNLGTATNPIWHFQDDAVTGNVGVRITTNPLQVVETGFTPQHYLDGQDGFTGISQYSEDLAFALGTPVPEPSQWALFALGIGLVLLIRGRRRMS